MIAREKAEQEPYECPQLVAQLHASVAENSDADEGREREQGEDHEDVVMHGRDVGRCAIGLRP